MLLVWAWSMQSTKTCVHTYLYTHAFQLHASGVGMEQARAQVKRNADVVAIERCELLEFGFEKAWLLLKKSPNLW
jgi:hypothetical protein